MEDKNLIKFAERIKNVRNQLGLSQKDFAEKIDISNSTLSDIEAARTKATFYFFFNISEAFDVNLTYLLHGRGRMFNNDNSTRGGKPVIQDVYPGIPFAKEVSDLVYWLQDDFVRPSLIARFNELRVMHKEYFEKVSAEKEEKDIKISEK